MILMVMNIIPTTMIMGHWSNGYKLRAKNLSSSVEKRVAAGELQIASQPARRLLLYLVICTRGKTEEGIRF